MMKSIFVFAIFMIIQSCSSLKDTTGQTNIKSKYNADNTIFKTGCTFIYTATWIKDNDTLEIKDTQGNQITKVILHVVPGRFFKQTKISWQYANELGYAGNKEITGLIEDDKEVWIHPPRSKILPFYLTESAPFPKIQFPIEKGKVWESEKYIPKGNYEENGLSGKVKNKWCVDSLLTLNEKEKLNEIWVISSTGHSNLGESLNKIFFSETEGFVRFEYTFPNKEKLIFELMEIRKPYNTQ